MKNRMVMSAMATMLTEEGLISEALINHYERRARGGVGLIIVEATAIDPKGISSPRQMMIYDDRFLEGLSRLSQAIKLGGAVPIIQLVHAGRQTSSKITGHELVSASPIPCPTIDEIPKELSPKEIADIVDKFARAAERAKRAGFEGVDIHGAHGYLVSQFLSPYSNKRKDEYGQGVEGRTKFASEIVQEIKRRNGKNFPVFFRMSAEEFVPDGLKLSESIETIKLLIASGIDAIHVSAGCDIALEWICQPMRLPRGCLVPLAEKVKREVTIPVMVAGRINDPYMAESILEEGKVDLVSIGRALLADPDFPRKSFEKRYEEIRRCVGCNVCIHSIFRPGRIRCLVNPAVGQEKEMEIRKAERLKKILVIGGGPAGMEAARVAKACGHEVVLIEKGEKLGGKLNIASVPPFKEELLNIIHYEEKQLEKLGVVCILGKKVTLEVVEEIVPDVVILASGSVSLIPQIPGIDHPHIFTCEELLTGRIKVGKRPIIIGGGGIGCETAEFLSRKGKKVTILELKKGLALDLELRTRKLLLESLNSLGVKSHTSISIRRIEEGKRVLCRDGNGEDRVIEGDNVILALGFKPQSELLEGLREKCSEVYAIGDCFEPRGIKEAIYEGRMVGRNI